MGLGTYLGRDDAVTDTLYQKAVERAVERGVNVLDTAINYRNQRSERAVGAALAAAIRRGALAARRGLRHDQGRLPGLRPATCRPIPREYFMTTYMRSGIVQPGDIVGSHCMTPRYLRDQLDRSRANLGLETVDVYYLHNPEPSWTRCPASTFLERVRVAFAALEEAAAEGKLRFYGAATWNGFRADPGDAGYLSLPELVQIAREVGGPTTASG